MDASSAAVRLRSTGFCRFRLSRPLFLFISVIFLHKHLIFGSFFAYFTVEIFLFLAYNVNLTGKVAVVC